MAIYNTSSDAANTAVRSFLTKVGEYYLGRSFNTGSGKGKSTWQQIKEQVFNNECAYCGEQRTTLQIEHLIMFSRKEYSLHHPGNIVPCCKTCNKRERKPDGSYANWAEHLAMVSERNGQTELTEARKEKIERHMKEQKYPQLNAEEKHSIRVIANSLYENIKLEAEKSLSLYKELDQAFVNKEESLSV